MKNFTPGTAQAEKCAKRRQAKIEKAANLLLEVLQEYKSICESSGLSWRDYLRASGHYCVAPLYEAYDTLYRRFELVDKEIIYDIECIAQAKKESFTAGD